MATITFDTLEFVEKLKAAGVPESQAKAEAEAVQDSRNGGSGNQVILNVLKVSCVK